MTRTEIKNGYMFILPWDINKVGGVNQVVKSLLYEITIENKFEDYLFINSWPDKNIITSNDNKTITFKSRLRQLGYKGFSFKEALIFIASLPFEIKKLLQLINNNKITVINAHFPELNLITFAIIKILFKNKFQLILSFHGSDVKAISEDSKFSKFQWRIIIRAADKIVPCSDDLAKKLCSILPSAQKKIHVIHNGINYKDIEQKLINGSPVYERVKPFIISIGSLDKNKGHDNLIHAYNQLPKTIKEEVNLVIIGKDTPYSVVLENMIKDVELQENIFIYKNISHQDTINTLANSLFFILASHSEGYPLVLLEAGLMKKAVIATNVGGISELIKDYDTGLLIKDNETQHIIDAISTLVQNQNNVRDKVADNLHKKVIVQSWTSVYKSYLNKL